MADRFPNYSNSSYQRPEGAANYRWFVPGDGILRDVITADIQRYLGNDALVKPGHNEHGTPGYLISAYRNLTPSMVQDIQTDSANYQNYNANQIPNARVSYEQSVVHQSRQYYGPTDGAQPPAIAPAPSQSSGHPSQPPQHSSHGQPNSYATPGYGSSYNPNSGHQAYSQQSSTSAQYPPQTPVGYPQSAAPSYPGTATAQTNQLVQPNYILSQTSPGPRPSNAEQQIYHNPFNGGSNTPRSHTQSQQPYQPNPPVYPTQTPSNTQQSAQNTAPAGYYLASDGRYYPNATR